MRGIDRTQGRTQSDASDATLVSTSFLIDTSPSKPSIESSSTKENTPLSKIFWLLLDIILLGFRQKFENRLQTYSASDYEEGKIGEWRTGQQEEWDRLGMTTTLMATISAASLAFSGIDNSWWVARGAFAGALGLSMCGYLVIHHFGVLSEGVDDNKILYAAGGYLSPGGSMTVVAITMSIPVLLSVYSAALAPAPLQRPSQNQGSVSLLEFQFYSD
ncbi:hypothetical protein BDQ12DRAFT_725234 [Crucibulum laeve]|uniref:Uncharacterized protein n=1 Tax=Crucibulum laeve TaxID=68775 RepID=A0A5C3LUV3_9AGAR|nr:hypothetical protein BDQ12DRAFT_725234 [Crucibulum laeve]